MTLGRTRLTGALGEAASGPGFHSQARADLGGDAVGASEQFALAVVKAVADALAGVRGKLEEQLAVFGVDPDPSGKAMVVAGLSGGVPLGIIKVELDAGGAVCVQCDSKDQFPGRSIHEGDRCARASAS